MKSLFLIFHTVRYLRPIQIRYQLWYRIRNYWRRITGFKYSLSVNARAYILKFTPWIDKPNSYNPPAFTFLNHKLAFTHKIDWNENVNGKLWTYNLNYMDYLLQSGMDKETGLELMDNFIQNLHQNQTGLEPYPVALRGINWVKFLSSTVNTKSQVTIEETQQPVDILDINSSLYAQYLILLNNLEYHLLANHLLEDGFSLLFGAFYFKDEKFYNKAKEIIETELNEQILNDGAHFERSPMYHQILLDRLLDCINLTENNLVFDGQINLLQLMRNKAAKMIHWLSSITLKDGLIPLFNDSTYGIAPTTSELLAYASRLSLPPQETEQNDQSNPISHNLLSASGYRRYNGLNYECIVNIGEIAPSYQPGHAHADTFSFVLSVNKKPIIVDSGISTYEANDNRLKERGTAAHNTVTVNGLNSSKVWSSFRIGKRAAVKLQKEDDTELITSHDGYKKQGTIHQRKWRFQHNQIEIIDSLSGKTMLGTFHLHFAPGLKPQLYFNTLICKELAIYFLHAKNLNLRETKIPIGYNQWKSNYKLEVEFKNQLKTQLKIIN